MNCYFYCTYAHSAAGFSMARLEGEQLVPAPSENHPLPKLAEAFFSYDRFYLLWLDLCRREGRHLQCSGSFLGIRGIHGRMPDGRSGTANLAFLANADEIGDLRRLGLTILGDYRGFCETLLGWLSVGGPCSYELNGPAFRQWMSQCRKSTKLTLLVSKEDPLYSLLPYLFRKEPPARERLSLRLAVPSSGWEEAVAALGDPAVWKSPPDCVLTEAEFEEIFVRNQPLWELREGDPSPNKGE